MMHTLSPLLARFQQQVLGGSLAGAGSFDEVTGHMDIYIQAYQGRMRQALASNFPVLHRAMGDDDFAQLAQAYCTAHPSTHRSIRWLGDSLLPYLEAHPAQLAHPALLDIARMDWAMRAAFDAASTPCLELQDLGQMAAGDWPMLRLLTVPSVQVLGLQWGVESLWHALHENAQAQTAEPLPAPHAMVIWRQQLECRWRSLDPHEALALGLAQQQIRFADLCEALQDAGVPEAAFVAVRLLQTWVQEGLLARPS